MSYTEIIKKAKPNVSENTIKQYNFTLGKIGNLIGATPDKFDKERQKYVDIYEDGLNNGTKSDKQKANWTNFEEIEKVRNMLQKEVHNAKIKTKVQTGRITPADRKLYQDYLLVSLYTLLPPVRLDYGNMELVTNKEYEKLGDEKEFHNYLVMNGRKAFFSMNEYKTSHKYGEKKIDIPPKLLSIIRSYMKINDTGFLLIDNRKKQLTPNGITKHLTRIFHNHIGKKISAQMIRHIYLSTKYESVAEEMKKDADIMGHGEGMQKKYIKKSD